MLNPQQSLETGNSFLDTLSLGVRSRFRQHLEPHTLKQGVLLGEPGVEVDHIYFPVRGVISTVALMRDGNAVEVGFAGHDGFSSIAAAFGSRVTPHTTVVQIAGSVLRMPVDLFLQEAAADRELHRRAIAYGEYSFIAATQFAACNRLHAIEARYARWLLMANDRVGGEHFRLTQEYAAEMLGVRRASVTLVAGALSAAGAISYRRGNIKVLDRRRLTQTACECYGAVNDELQRLMGYSVRFDTTVERSANRLANLPAGVISRYDITNDGHPHSERPGENARRPKRPRQTTRPVHPGRGAGGPHNRHGVDRAQHRRVAENGPAGKRR